MLIVLLEEEEKQNSIVSYFIFLILLNDLHFITIEYHTIFTNTRHLAHPCQYSHIQVQSQDNLHLCCLRTFCQPSEHCGTISPSNTIHCTFHPNPQSPIPLFCEGVSVIYKTNVTITSISPNHITPPPVFVEYVLNTFLFWKTFVVFKFFY